MPIYEYSCVKCGKTIEVIQKMSDKPLKTHAKCGGKLTKLISRSGFQFKGTGWYVTDYAKKGQTDSASKSSESSEKKTETSKETSTEKAASAKSETKSSPKASKSKES